METFTLHQFLFSLTVILQWVEAAQFIQKLSTISMIFSAVGVINIGKNCLGFVIFVVVVVVFLA